MFVVLFICTGNRCRSPMAEAFFSNLTHGLPVEVRSGGTWDLGPALPTGEAIEVALERGADISGHTATPLLDVPSDDVDLAIGFERDHVAAAVVEAGIPQERVFLLEELAELVAGIGAIEAPDPEERAREVVDRAHARRAVQPPVGVDLETPDPIGRPFRVYTSVARRIDDLCGRVASALFGASAISSGASSYSEGEPDKAALRREAEGAPGLFKWSRSRGTPRAPG